VVSLICFSCKTTQWVTHSSQQTDTEHKNKTEISESYTSVHYKGLATVNLNGQSQNCQFNLVNVVDRFVYVQLNIAGIEIGRALVTPDNILFINKLQKEFFNGNYAVLENLLNLKVDYYTVQSIFSGIPTVLPDGVTLFYQKDERSYEYPFFSALHAEYYGFSLRMDIKKVTFNEVPEVSATVPKGYTPINLSP